MVIERQVTSALLPGMAQRHKVGSGRFVACSVDWVITPTDRVPIALANTGVMWSMSGSKNTIDIAVRAGPMETIAAVGIEYSQR